MSDLSFDDAIAVLEEKKQDIGEGVFEEIKRRIAYFEHQKVNRSRDDKMEASKLSVEMAKVILTVDVAGLVAVAGFVQFARNDNVAWFTPTIGLFALAAVLGAFAIYFGFMAISAVYKRADGREGADKDPWSTLVSKDSLNYQAVLSGLALISLFVAIAFWPNYEGGNLINVSSSSRGMVLAGGESVAVHQVGDVLQFEGINGSVLVVGKDEEMISISCK